MTLSSAIAFFGLHLVYTDLLGFAGFNKVGRNGCTLNIGAAENSVLPVDHGKDLVKSESGACFIAELFYIDHITLSNTVLLSAC